MLTSKIDATTQKVQYTYDPYEPVIMIRRYLVNIGSEDTSQRTTFYYDSNPFNGTFSHCNWRGDLQRGVQWHYTPAGNGILSVSLGPLDQVAPPAGNPQTIATSVFPNRVDFQWQGMADDANGIGVAFYEFLRNSVWMANTTRPEFSDGAVAASTTYNDQIYACDFHYNCSATAVTVQTPPAGSVDIREVGVRPTGTYWGAGGEQIDLRSGNVNYTMPLIKAMGRGGWGVGFNLTYNSQNWRQDPAGTWKLGQDVGYGFGWKMLAGSLTA